MFVIVLAAAPALAAAADLTVDGTAVIPVTIDVMPGDTSNTIKIPASIGYDFTPVAILSTADFNALTVNPATVVFAGATVARRQNGLLVGVARDVNLDGLPDLVLYFWTRALQVTVDSVEATLTGTTFDGMLVTGTDSVQILP